MAVLRIAVDVVKETIKGCENTNPLRVCLLPEKVKEAAQRLIILTLLATALTGESRIIKQIN